MRGWKNTAGKKTQREHKGQKQQWEKRCVLGFRLLHPRLLACCELYCFLLPSLNNALTSERNMFPQA